MKSIQLIRLGLGSLTGLALALACSTGATTANAENWPTWRGPTANGVAPGGNPPTEFSESKNIQWKRFQNNGVIDGLKNRDGWSKHWNIQMNKNMFHLDYTMMH